MSSTDEWIECKDCDGQGGWWTKSGDGDEAFEICKTCDGMEGWWQAPPQQQQTGRDGGGE